MIDAPIIAISFKLNNLQRPRAWQSEAYLKSLYHVIGVHLYTTHVELNRTDMIADDLFRRCTVLRELFTFLFINLFLGFDARDQSCEKFLSIGSLDFKLCSILLLLCKMQSIKTRVLNLSLVHDNGRALWVLDKAASSAVDRSRDTLGLVPSTSCLDRLLRYFKTLADIDAPTVADSINVKTVSQHHDLASRVPVRRHNNLVSVNNIVLERCAF